MTQKRAWDLIKARHADLLLFGEVRERDKAVKVWVVNENGGCNLHPKPTIIEHGDLPGDFTDEQKKNLIIVSLKEIQSACLNQSSIVWSDFAKRMNKMEMFLNHFDFSQPKSLYFADSYIEAMGLLYGNGQGDAWFSKGEEFAKRVLNKDQDKDQGTSKALSWVYTQYGVLLNERFNKMDKNYQNAAFGAFDEAIGLDPMSAPSYEARGEAYSDKREWDRAIDDFTKAIALDPEYGRSYCYCHRGGAYLQKGEWNRAIEDFTKAIGLNPKPDLYDGRGEAYSKKGDFDSAIEDYTKAIELDPKFALAYVSRGEAYGKKGDWDRANEDYSQAIRLDPKNADLWNERCYARAITGHLQQALSDCNQALDLEPNNANVRDSRAFVYLKMGKLEDAIADYNIALGLGPKLAASLYGRGVAKLKKGDTDSGNSDIESAKRIQPDIADEFQRYGIQFKQLSPRPRDSQTTRAHRSRRPAGR
ncbi:MAG: tetratricopeptide repeat protein [Pseudomonadota bacterium]|nr:tetratricopeptide repeat protein [Pseudomonadota bacterium]